MGVVAARAAGDLTYDLVVVLEGEVECSDILRTDVVPPEPGVHVEGTTSVHLNQSGEAGHRFHGVEAA
jgi:hypothetical protein